MKSEQINELAEALAKAQAGIVGARKDSKNPFFKSNYADLASVWDACREPLSSNGLCVMQANRIAEDGDIIIVTTLAHSSGQWFDSELKLKPQKNDPQGMGSCITYGRRYSLAAITGVAQIDDDAEAAMERDAKKREAAEKLAQENQAKEYEKLILPYTKTIQAIKDGIATKDLSTASEAWSELTDDEKKLLWKAPSKGGPFTTEERKVMQTTKFREANGENNSN